MKLKLKYGSAIFLISVVIFSACGQLKPKPTTKAPDSSTTPEKPLMPTTPPEKPLIPTTPQEPPSPPTPPVTPVQTIQGCPASPDKAMAVGFYFENQLVDGNLLIKPWLQHSHAFSEVKALGWSESDLKLAATVSRHVDLKDQTIRFANNDIAAYLNNSTLCPLTMKFLLSFLAQKEQDILLAKLKSNDIDIIIAHQTKRFKDLESILDKNLKYHVKFPGINAQQHALGTGIAKRSWSNPDHQKMIDHLSSLIHEFEQKYPGRVHFGNIGDFSFDQSTGDCDRTQANPQGVPGAQNDRRFMIHVWGANEGNFNFEENTPGPFGSGQASCFKNQRLGVFGISTLPGQESTLMAADKLLGLY